MKPKYELVIQRSNGKKAKAYFLAAAGLPQKSRKLQGLRKFANITLKRGYTVGRSLYDWHQRKAKTKGKGSKASIYLLAESGARISYWNLNAWPSKYQGPSFSGKGNDVAVEELQLRGEGIERGDLD